VGRVVATDAPPAAIAGPGGGDAATQKVIRLAGARKIALCL
jgi:hypothetical protein